MRIIDSYPESNYAGGGGTLDGVNYNFYGQTFTVPSNCTLIGCAFYLKRVGEPSDFNFGLYSTTGAADAEVPSTLRAFSDVESSMDVLGTDVAIHYAPFTVPYAATPGVYAVTSFLDGGTLTDYIIVGADNTSPSHSGHRVSSLNEILWTYSTAADVIFYVYAQDDTTGNMFLLF